MPALGFKQIGGLGIPRPLLAHVAMGAREKALAMYLTSPDHLNNSVLVTDQGIYLLDASGSRFVSYETINRLDWYDRYPSRLTDDDFVTLLRKCTEQQYPLVLEFLRMLCWSARTKPQWSSEC